MVLLRIVVVGLLLLCVQTGLAQQAAEPVAEEASTTVAATASTSYETGNWLSWKKMTGDWGGVRTDLANAGITFDIDYNQVFQGNAHGGASTKNGFRLSGKTDLELTLDTGRMGLWPGGAFIFHAESLWGAGINPKVGSLLPVNTNAALVGSAEDNWGYDEGARFVLSEFIFQQVLFEGKLILLAGKLFGGRAFDANVFADNERTQFMNVALRKNVMIPAFLPYTTMGAGAVVNPTLWLSIMTAVADSDGRAKTTGFETAFHGPTNTSVIHEWAFKIKPFDLPGNQRIGFVWSSKDFDRVDPPWLFNRTAEMVFRMLGPELALKVVNTIVKFDDAGDNVMLYYNFDQYLYTEANDPTQGIGVFGRFGWARQDVNPVAHFYTIGVSGKGVVPTRDNDTFGVGYFYADLSNQLPVFYHSEQGVECYYNIEIAPWLHISPDLQVIMNPGGADFHDVSVVYGLRMAMNL